jgi:hypothetical protein
MSTDNQADILRDWQIRLVNISRMVAQSSAPSAPDLQAEIRYLNADISSVLEGHNTLAGSALAWVGFNTDGGAFLNLSTRMQDVEEKAAAIGGSLTPGQDVADWARNEGSRVFDSPLDAFVAKLKQAFGGIGIFITAVIVLFLILWGSK